jgi:antitoxin (DNA-binding transcriptional repressor) of toxin-antitoxin stability system
MELICAKNQREGSRQRFRELLGRVKQGEEVVVLRHGQAMARLVPSEKVEKRLPSPDDFRHSIGTTGTSSAEFLREERDAR